MRKLFLVTAVAFLFVSASISYAGFNVLKKVQDKVERRLDNEIDKSIDKGLDETEKTIKGEGDESAGESSGSQTQSTEKKGKKESSSSSGTSQQQLKAWSKYDFVPGDEIIFVDDLAGEENGEFPSRWDLYRGNVEIAVYGGENVINFATVQPCDIVPLMTQKGDYLPEKFTLEFDAYFSEFCTTYYVKLSDVINQKPPKTLPYVNIKANYVGVEGFGGTNLTDRDYPYLGTHSDIVQYQSPEGVLWRTASHEHSRIFVPNRWD